MINRETDLRIQTVCLAILTIFAVFTVLKVLSNILVPFTMAVFLTLVLIPIVDFFIRKLKIRRAIALVLTLFIGFMLMLGVYGVVSVSVQQFRGKTADYERQLTESIEWAQASLPIAEIIAFISPDEEGATDSTDPEPEAGESEPTAAESDDTEEAADSLDTEQDSSAGEDSAPSDEEQDSEDEPVAEDAETPIDFTALIPKGSVQNAMNVMLNSTMTVLGQGILVMMFSAFLLAGSSTRKVRPKGSVIAEIEIRVQKYIGLKVVISAVTGSLVYLILTILGIDYALTFGVFTFILNFIPNVGSFIAVALPAPIVFLAWSGGEMSLLVASLAIILPLCIQLAIGNFVEPKVMGDTLGMHPVTVLMSLILWGFLWGFPGALLAVPMTSIAKIIFDRVEVTRPIARVLEGDLDSLDKT